MASDSNPGDLHSRVRTWFERCITLAPAERTRLLAELQRTDPEAAEELSSLLSFHEDTRGILDRSVSGVAASLTPTGMEPPVQHGPAPTRVGKFQVVRELGRGGMGVVYEAVQDFPKRTVALKLVRPEFVTTTLTRRFSHEAEALAMLQDPGIAALYEAGFAEQSPGVRQPYIAMEMVAGQSLTTYARSRELSVRDRLSLLARVADAVDHAHKRGVIHRDLKPGNIVVTDSGQPKVLDFGVARLTAQDSAATIQTSAGQIVGTLGYMSPEQVEADPRKIDARSDVYALGVLLFELLAGKPPVEVVGLSVAQAVTKIREQEPALLGRLDATLRGDVEAIVAKAVEKDQARRYQSAGELAADIRRYLSDEPVLAHPQTAWYQATKFARRHRAFVASIAAVMTVLVVGIVATAWQAHAANVAREQAQKEKVRAEEESATATAVLQYFIDLLHQGHPEYTKGNDPTIGQLVKQSAPGVEKSFEKQPRVRYELHGVLGSVFAATGDLEHSAEQYSEQLALAGEVFPDQPGHWVNDAASLGDTYSDMDDFAKAEPLLREAVRVGREKLGPDHDETVWAEICLAHLLDKMDKDAEAEPLVRHALAVRERLFGPTDRRTLVAVNQLALTLQDLERPQEAEPFARRNMDATVEQLGADHPDAIAARANFARLLMTNDKAEESIALLEPTVADARRTLGPTHPMTLAAAVGMATTLSSAGRQADAIPYFEEALSGYKATIGAEHIDALLCMNNLTVAYEQSKRLDDAQRVGSELLAVMQKREPESTRTAVTMGNVARIEAKLGHYARAVELARESVRVATGAFPPESPFPSRLRCTLGIALVGDGKADEGLRELEDAYAGLTAHAQPYDGVVVTSAKMVHGFLEKQGRTEDAAKWKQRAEAQKPG
ncbi:MAG: serine/threonine-protein kinase [Phycisphaerales bacterium]